MFCEKMLRRGEEVKMKGIKFKHCLNIPTPTNVMKSVLIYYILHIDSYEEIMRVCTQPILGINLYIGGIDYVGTLKR